MIGLPTKLYDRCAKTLRDCEGFKDKEILKALFATDELLPYQDGLPEADNKKAHVTKVINYLLAKGGSVFVLFLDRLLKQETEKGQQYKKMEHLIKDVRRALSPEVTVPFVTVAMTHEEAKRLSEESAFNDFAAPIEQTWFQELKKTWSPDKMSGWLDHYGQSREAWKPDTQDGHTIERIMLQMTADVNQNPQQHGPPIKLDFRSIDFFAENYDTRLRAWRELSLGGVLIVDTLSLFHPLIYRRVLQSELGANHHVAIAMATFSPFVSGQKQAPLIEKEIKRRMQRAFARSKWDEQELCRQVESMDSLRRWIKHSALPKVVDIIIKQEEEKPNPNRISMMREKERTETQVGSRLFGGGGNS